MARRPVKLPPVPEVGDHDSLRDAHAKYIENARKQATAN